MCKGFAGWRKAPVLIDRQILENGFAGKGQNRGDAPGEARLGGPPAPDELLASDRLGSRAAQGHPRADWLYGFPRDGPGAAPVCQGVPETGSQTDGFKHESAELG